MKNSKCVVCGTEFEPREGKLYCSEKCTQYAYRQKKKDQEPEEPEAVQSLTVKNDVLYSFDGREYNKVKEKFKNFKPKSIVEYAFFRRNLTGIPDFDFIAEYIDSFFPFPGKVDANNPFYDEEHTMYKSYQEFEKLYFEGRIHINFNAELSEENTDTNNEIIIGS